MNTLEQYLIKNKIVEQSRKNFVNKNGYLYLDNGHKFNKCCNIKHNIVYDGCGGYYSCSECATIQVGVTKDITQYKENASFVVKSFIQMSYKYRKLIRLQKWSNYSYYEVRNHKLIDFIDTLKIENTEIKSFAKLIFLREFVKVRTRAKVKMGLIAFCIYKAHLMFKTEIDLDDILKMLDITEKHYNSSIKKLTEDKLYYPKNINKYLDLIDNKINKNYLIRTYNNLLEKSKGFNSKTILLSLIFYILQNNNDLDKKKFFKTFKISQTSVNSIVIFIKEHHKEIMIFNQDSSDEDE